MNLFLLGICCAAVFVESYNSLNAILSTVICGMPASVILSASVLPKGSIAFKLGLLAVGASHFAITKKPKNIWDIAAGTHICLKRGIFLFQNGIKISHIQKDPYDANLTWVSDHYKNRVLKI